MFHPPLKEGYPLIHKVVAYVTRVKDGEKQILVFEHDKPWSEAGIQVPAGTVELSEDFEQAVIREVQEEAGLNGLKLNCKIGEQTLFRHTHNQNNHRHYYHLELVTDTPDRWEHIVKSNDRDNGMKFICYWMSLSEAQQNLVGDFQFLIHKII